jgi:hypothetical protein
LLNKLTVDPRNDLCYSGFLLINSEKEMKKSQKTKLIEAHYYLDGNCISISEDNPLLPTSFFGVPQCAQEFYNKVTALSTNLPDVVKTKDVEWCRAFKSEMEAVAKSGVRPSKEWEMCVPAKVLMFCAAISNLLRTGELVNDDYNGTEFVSVPVTVKSKK